MEYVHEIMNKFISLLQPSWRKNGKLYCKARPRILKLARQYHLASMKRKQYCSSVKSQPHRGCLLSEATPCMGESDTLSARYQKVPKPCVTAGCNEWKTKRNLQDHMPEWSVAPQCTRRGAIHVSKPNTLTHTVLCLFFFPSTGQYHQTSFPAVDKS